MRSACVASALCAAQRAQQCVYAQCLLRSEQQERPPKLHPQNLWFSLPFLLVFSCPFPPPPQPLLSPNYGYLYKCPSPLFDCGCWSFALCAARRRIQCAPTDPKRPSSPRHRATPHSCECVWCVRCASLCGAALSASRFSSTATRLPTTTNNNNNDVLQKLSCLCKRCVIPNLSFVIFSFSSCLLCEKLVWVWEARPVRARAARSARSASRRPPLAPAAAPSDG